MAQEDLSLPLFLPLVRYCSADIKRRMRWDGQGNPVAAQAALCGRPVAVSVLAGEIMLEITRLKNLLIRGEDYAVGKGGKVLRET